MKLRTEAEAKHRNLTLWVTFLFILGLVASVLLGIFIKGIFLLLLGILVGGLARDVRYLEEQQSVGPTIEETYPNPDKIVTRQKHLAVIKGKLVFEDNLIDLEDIEEQWAKRHPRSR